MAANPRHGWPLYPDIFWFSGILPLLFLIVVLSFETGIVFAILVSGDKPSPQVKKKC